MIEHPLDPVIEALEEDLRDAWLHRHWDAFRQEAKKLIRDYASYLRACRDARDGTRAEQLREEGRREERARVVNAGRRFARHMMSEFKGTPFEKCSDLADEMVGEFVDCIQRGDHWRGGEEERRPACTVCRGRGVTYAKVQYAGLADAPQDAELWQEVECGACGGSGLQRRGGDGS